MYVNTEYVAEHVNNLVVVGRSTVQQLATVSLQCVAHRSPFVICHLSLIDFIEQFVRFS